MFLKKEVNFLEHFDLLNVKNSRRGHVKYEGSWVHEPWRLHVCHTADCLCNRNVPSPALQTPEFSTCHPRLKHGLRHIKYI